MNLEHPVEGHGGWERAAAAVATWARATLSRPAVLESAPHCAALFEKAGTSQPDPRGPEAAGATSLRVVERVFETSLDADHRRLEGAVYTPEFVVDYLLSQAAAIGNGDPSRTVLDPCCGGGAFLLPAATQLGRESGASLSKVIETQIFGADKNPDAVLMSGALLEMLVAAAGEDPRQLRSNLIAIDSLSTEPSDLLDRLGATSGLDVVATNPPYVKLQNLPDDYREILSGRFASLTAGNFSLALLFLVQCHLLLAEGGVAALITQNNLFTSLAGQPIRQYLARTGALRRIVDFGDKHVFQDASAYTCLIFVGNGASGRFEFGTPTGQPGAESLASVTLHELQTNDLDAKKWRLAARADLENLRRLEANGTRLDELCDIRVGFATLKDRVFFLDADGGGTTTDGRYLRIERDVRRAALKVADASSDMDVIGKRRQILYPYHGTGRDLAAFTEGDMRARFPNAYEYLLSWKQELAGRDKGKSPAGAWFEWGRRQALEAPGPKLLTKTFNSRPQFFLDPSDSLFCNGYSLRPTARWPHSIEVLQRILESPVMDYYAHLTSFQIDGGYQCYQKNFIAPFCIPDFSVEWGAALLAAEGPDAEALVAELFGIDTGAIEDVVRNR